MQPVSLVSSVNEYVDIAPLFKAMKTQTDHLPKNSLPTETLGTVQENTHSIPQVTLYNAHGILDKKNPNTLIGYA